MKGAKAIMPHRILSIGCLAVVVSALFVGKAAAMSLVGANIDVRQAILSAARLGGFNVILDDAVQGTVSLNLRDIKPTEVVAAVAAAKNLAVEKQSDGLYIVRRGDGHRQVYVAQLKYADPNRAAQLVGAALDDNSAENGQSTDKKQNAAPRQTKRNFGVTVDATTNTLVIYGTQAQIAAAKKIVDSIDILTEQVSLEAKVMAVDKTAAKELGIEWSWSNLPQYPNRTTDYETRYRTVENPDGTRTTVSVEVPRTTVTRSYNNGAIPGIIQFGKGPDGHPFEFYYEAKLNALITDGKAKLVSRPNIVTLQGQEATINIGGEIPVPRTVATNTTATSSVDYKKVGIILRCTPRVNEDGFITSLVHTEVSSPVYVPEMRAYRIQNRSADTTVRLRDGETMVIGGLIGSEESHNFSKVPFLGDIPLFGALFRNRKSSKSDSEILIFLTAHRTERGINKNGGINIDSR